ncbi:MAG: hypothetical protein OCD03_11190 [Hyphomicrobiales bacterium]
MYPKIYNRTETDDFCDKIISCIKNFECSLYFSHHLGKPQSEQKRIVQNFQNALHQKLTTQMPKIAWIVEYSPTDGRRDSIDIYGELANLSVIIEIDKHRADQVAKKFVSRTSLFINREILYISLCYPGTKKMPVGECIKYFEYCRNISKSLGNYYAGLIIE